MGRAPCCDKANVKRGPWSPEEDSRLKSYIEQYGTGGNWIALPQKIGLKRCGKSCRLRWLNYLRPNIKHGGFSEEEDNIICRLFMNIGSRWSIIAGQLPGRTDNDIKNYWNTKLKKKLLGKHRSNKDQRAATKRKVMNDTVPQQEMALPVVDHLPNQLGNMVCIEDNHQQDHQHHNQSIGISFFNPNYTTSLYPYDHQLNASAYLNNYGYPMYDHDLSNIIPPPYYDFPGMDDQLDIMPEMMNYSGDHNMTTGTTSPAESNVTTTTSWSDMTSNGVVYSPMGYYNTSTGISHGDGVFQESSDLRMHQQIVL